MLQNDEDDVCNFNLATGLSLNPLLRAHQKMSVDVKPQTLTIPIPVRGNAQQWLNANVFAAANPYFALSDSDGNIRITDLPPGKWEFQVWHERPGFVKRANWPRGRFTMEIKPGENDLGTIKLPPATFKESGRDTKEPTPTGTVQPLDGAVNQNGADATAINAPAKMAQLCRRSGCGRKGSADRRRLKCFCSTSASEVSRARSSGRRRPMPRAISIRQRGGCFEGVSRR